MRTSPTAGRPDFRPGYGIHSDAGGLLAWDDVEARLRASRSYWVATVRRDGRPHVMPVWGVWIDGTLLFSTDPDSVKGRALRRDPRVVVHLESGDDAVIVEGEVSALAPADAEGDRFVTPYFDKYGWKVDINQPAFAGFRVRPRSVLAWREADFTATATRFTFEQQGTS